MSFLRRYCIAKLVEMPKYNMYRLYRKNEYNNSAGELVANFY